MASKIRISSNCFWYKLWPGVKASRSMDSIIDMTCTTFLLSLKKWTNRRLFPLSRFLYKGRHLHLSSVVESSNWATWRSSLRTSFRNSGHQMPSFFQLGCLYFESFLKFSKVSNLWIHAKVISQFQFVWEPVYSQRKSCNEREGRTSDRLQLVLLWDHRSLSHPYYSATYWKEQEWSHNLLLF